MLCHTEALQANRNRLCGASSHVPAGSTQERSSCQGRRQGRLSSCSRKGCNSWQAAGQACCCGQDLPRCRQAHYDCRYCQPACARRQEEDSSGRQRSVAPRMSLASSVSPQSPALLPVHARGVLTSRVMPRSAAAFRCRQCAGASSSCCQDGCSQGSSSSRFGLQDTSSSLHAGSWRHCDSHRAGLQQACCQGCCCNAFRAGSQALSRCCNTFLHALFLRVSQQATLCSYTDCTLVSRRCNSSSGGRRSSSSSGCSSSNGCDAGAGQRAQAADAGLRVSCGDAVQRTGLQGVGAAAPGRREAAQPQPAVRAGACVGTVCKPGGVAWGMRNDHIGLTSTQTWTMNGVIPHVRREHSPQGSASLMHEANMHYSISNEPAALSR